MLACGMRLVCQLCAGFKVLLIEVAGTNVLGLCGVAILPEAGGRLGEVWVAVSWVWHPRAPHDRWDFGSGVSFVLPFPVLWGNVGRRM